MTAPKQYLERAFAAASRAVAIDPDFGPGRAALAMVHGWLNHDWAEANAEMERAVQADPSSALVRWAVLQEKYWTGSP